MRLEEIYEKLFDVLNETKELEIEDIEADFSDKKYVVTLSDNNKIEVGCKWHAA